MKNDLIESRLRRDTTAAAFLVQAKTSYADIEADVAPLRMRLEANLERCGVLAQQVLGADADDNPNRKKGIRSQLTALLNRLTRALRAVALSTGDATLRAGAGNPGELPSLRESSFSEEATRLLGLVNGREAALAARRFTAEHAQQARTLLAAFTSAITEGRLNDVSGSTSRQMLETLIKDSARIIEELKVFFDTYQDDDTVLWKSFRSAIKVVKRGGGSGGGDAGEAPQE